MEKIQKNIQKLTQCYRCSQYGLHQQCGRKTPNQYFKLTNFAPTLEKVHNRVVKKETIITAFKTTGTWPFDQNSVHYERCLGANKPKPIEKNVNEK